MERLLSARSMLGTGKGAVVQTRLRSWGSRGHGQEIPLMNNYGREVKYPERKSCKTEEGSISEAGAG